LLKASSEIATGLEETTMDMEIESGFEFALTPAAGPDRRVNIGSNKRSARYAHTDQMSFRIAEMRPGVQRIVIVYEHNAARRQFAVARLDGECGIGHQIDRIADLVIPGRRVGVEGAKNHVAAETDQRTVRKDGRGAVFPNVRIMAERRGNTERHLRPAQQMEGVATARCPHQRVANAPAVREIAHPAVTARLLNDVKEEDRLGIGHKRGISMEIGFVVGFGECGELAAGRGAHLDVPQDTTVARFGRGRGSQEIAEREQDIALQFERLVLEAERRHDGGHGPALEAA
jgi:hypothetical protein